MFRGKTLRLLSIVASPRTTIRVGDTHKIERIFTREDVQKYATLVGDENPIHLNDEAARNAGFPRPVVHGMLVSSLFSNIMGMHLPGPQSIYLKQFLEFRSPVFVDDNIIITVEVLMLHASRHLILIENKAIREKDGAVCVRGEALGLNKILKFEGTQEWVQRYAKL